MIGSSYNDIRLNGSFFVKTDGTENSPSGNPQHTDEKIMNDTEFPTNN